MCRGHRSLGIGCNVDILARRHTITVRANPNSNPHANIDADTDAASGTYAHANP